jgi:hypothetical protein
MDLETRKLSFVKEFLRLQNVEIISKFETLLRKERSESIEEIIVPMTMKQLNSEIDQALADSKKGNMIKASDLLAKFEK